MLKAIHAQEDRRSAQDKIREVIAKLKGLRPTKAAELVEARARSVISRWKRCSTHFPGRQRLRSDQATDEKVRKIVDTTNFGKASRNVADEGSSADEERAATLVSLTFLLAMPSFGAMAALVLSILVTSAS